MVVFYLILVLFITSDAIAEEHGGGGGEKPAESALKLEDIVVPVLLREEVKAYYSLSLTIEANDPSKNEELAHFGPRIRDAIIKELYVILPLIWDKNEQPKIDMLKKRLEKVAKKTTPDDTVGLVIINSFQLNDAKK